MAQIYLIRHGETDYNLRNIVQGGGIDSDLNDTGRRQGAAFYKQYGHIRFDQIYCTELKRTRQTLAGFANAGHEISTLPELNEFGWGALEGVEGNDFIRGEFEKILSRWREGDFHARVEQGESPLEAWDRARPGIVRVLAAAKPESKILICSHGRIMRVVLSQLSGYGLRKMDLFPHQNTALNLLMHIPLELEAEFPEGVSVPGIPTGRFRIQKLNDVSHLS